MGNLTFQIKVALIYFKVKCDFGTKFFFAVLVAQGIPAMGFTSFSHIKVRILKVFQSAKVKQRYHSTRRHF